MNLIKKHTSRSFLLAGLVLTSLVAGCSNSDNGPSAGTTLPQVLSTSPAEAATKVALDSPVVATFSEKMDAATLTDESFTLIDANKNVIPGAVTYDAATKTATFTAADLFTANTEHTARLTTAVTSDVGNPLATDYVWEFTSAPPVPLALPTSPQDKATAVAFNSRKVIVSFSEAMDKDTVEEPGNFTLTDADGQIVPGTVSYDVATKTATFTATDPLEPDTEYTARLTTDVTSAAGVPLATEQVWTFKTGLTADETAPVVTVTDPIDGVEDVFPNRNLTATFDEDLDPATISGSSFTLTVPGAQDPILVPGAVSYSNKVVTFNPSSDLTESTVYTATLTTAITDVAGNALADPKVWSFTTAATTVAGPAPVDLRSAGDFVILTKTGITNVPMSAITGNIGASPITAAAMDDVTCTEMQGTSIIYGADVAYTGEGGLTPCFKGTAPDNTKVANAVLDMGTAYTDAAGRTTPDFTELGAGNISGMTLAPGLYKWGTGVLIASQVTLEGGPNDVWIFQIAKNLTQASNVHIVLAGGAEPKNIFWQVGGGVGVEIGTGAVFKGVIIAEKAIHLRTGATVEGRLLSHTAVTLEMNPVTQPAP